MEMLPSDAEREAAVRNIEHNMERARTYTHVVSIVPRQRYVEIKDMVKCQQPVTRIPTGLIPYHSCVGATAGALSLHVQRLIGDMRNFQLPTHQDCTI
jgi:hypothetical protein